MFTERTGMIFSLKAAAVEFTADEVRIAVVKTGGRRPKLLELHARPFSFEDPEDRFNVMVSALEDALSDLKSKPVAWVLCAGSDAGIVRMLTIPFKGKRRVNSAVRFELEPHLAFPIEDLYVDFNIAAEFNGETEVLAMGIRKNLIQEQLEALRACGIEAGAVTLDTVALTGLYAGARKKIKGLQAILHVRRESASLVILYNGTIAFFRHIESGADAFRGAPRPAARDIQNTIRAFLAKWRGEGQIDRLQITGIDLAPAERDQLSEALQLPVENTILINELKSAPQAKKEKEADAAANRWEAVAGAAHGAAGGTHTIDFIREEHGWGGILGGMTPCLLFTSCLALMALLTFAVYYHMAAARNESALAALEKQVAQRNTEIDALAGEGLGEDIDIQPFRDPALLDILREISLKMPEEKVQITEIRMQRPGARSWWLSIEGEVKDASIFKNIFAELRKSSLFRVQEEHELSMHGETTTFAIKAYRNQEESGDDNS
jgi:hypothetical protein